MSSTEMMHDLPVEEEANIELEDSAEAEQPEQEAAEPAPEEPAKEKDEADEYSESVQKRISKLTSRMREAERREKAALDYATSLKNQYDEVAKRAKQSDESYLTEYDNRLKVSESTLNEQLKRAIELGDADAQVELSRKMSEHALETQRLEYARERLQTEQPAEAQAAQPQQTQQAQPSPKAEEWSAKNEWFGTDEPMTLTAFSIHKQLVQEENFNPESDEYYSEIDKRMRENFPHKFANEQPVEQEIDETPQPRTSNVAPTGRATSAPRKNGKKSVKLTPSQVAIAKKLGVSLEDYAKQVALLETRSQ